MSTRGERQIERSLDKSFGPHIPNLRSTPSPLNTLLRQRKKAALAAQSAPAPASESMEDIAARRRSERIAAAGLAKAQHAETEAEKKKWDEEVRKATAEGKKYKKAVAIKVRQLHANASVEELFELVDILSAAGEKYASLEASVFAYV